MKVLIDTSSLMALVRYYIPFDKHDSLKDLFGKKVKNKEIIILDKVAIESKRMAKGFIVKSLEYLEEKKNHTNTESLLPNANFLRDLESRLCYVSRRTILNEVEYENRKKAFLDSADAKLILFCMSNKDPLNLDKTILVTEETRTDNDLKVFKKLPEMCELLGIEHCNLPTLFENHFSLQLSKYLK